MKIKKILLFNLAFNVVPLISHADYDYLCTVGSIYNIPCAQLWEAHKPSEDIFLKKRDSLTSKKTFYHMQPNTHRIWLTSSSSPQEVPPYQLSFYEKSLQFYIGKPFVHYFWCNDKGIIPQTIARIQNFSVPVSIHEISELKEQFFTWNLFQKLLSEKLFTFATDLARQEVLVHKGGLYADIGAEQLHDFESYFQKYERLYPISQWGLDKHFLGASKNSSFFTRSLKLIIPLMQEILARQIYIPSSSAHWFLERHLWRLLLNMEEEHLERIGYLYEGQNYKRHGLSSWNHKEALLSVRSIAKTQVCEEYIEEHQTLLSIRQQCDDSRTCVRPKPYIKPIVSEYEYVCALGDFYNLTCGKVWNAIIPYEEEFPKNNDISFVPNASYLIEPNTHRMWLTSLQNPHEVSTDRLEFYKKSLQFYKDKNFTHHFWCNNKNLIPRTIAIIQNFNVPVIIHEISEIQDSFITKGIYEKFLNDNYFAYASDLARQEILLQLGGLYADIGIEQLRDIEPLFKKHETLFVISAEWGGLNSFTLGAKKQSPLLNQTLTFIHQAATILSELPVMPDPFTLVGLPIWHGWRIFLAFSSPELTTVGFVYKDKDVKWNGHGSWWKDKRYNNYNLNYWLDVSQE